MFAVPALLAVTRTVSASPSPDAGLTLATFGLLLVTRIAPVYPISLMRKVCEVVARRNVILAMLVTNESGAGIPARCCDSFGGVTISCGERIGCRCLPNAIR
jgi:hypothetical protein